jgi:putative membrane protein
MAIMMIAFWGAIILVAVLLIRRSDHPSQSQTHGTPTPPRLTPQDILAERLARGEIDPDEYRQRLEALQHQP